jgi:hypothetical protein
MMCVCVCVCVCDEGRCGVFYPILSYRIASYGAESIDDCVSTD